VDSGGSYQRMKILVAARRRRPSRFVSPWVIACAVAASLGVSCSTGALQPQSSLSSAPNPIFVLDNIGNAPQPFRLVVVDERTLTVTAVASIANNIGPGNPAVAEDCRTVLVPDIGHRRVLVLRPMGATSLIDQFAFAVEGQLYGVRASPGSRTADVTHASAESTGTVLSRYDIQTGHETGRIELGLSRLDNATIVSVARVTETEVVNVYGVVNHKIDGQLSASNEIASVSFPDLGQPSLVRTILPSTKSFLNGRIAAGPLPDEVTMLDADAEHVYVVQLGTGTIVHEIALHGTSRDPVLETLVTGVSGLAVVSDPESYSIWSLNLSDGTVGPAVRLSNPVRRAAFTPEGKYLVAVDALYPITAGSISFYDARTLNKIRTLQVGMGQMNLGVPEHPCPS
jgi:hypothetical protein